MNPVRHVPRHHDDEILHWIRLRASGATWTSIAHDAGRQPNSIQRACQKVMEADVNESGEPEREVRKCYGYQTYA